MVSRLSSATVVFCVRKSPSVEVRPAVPRRTGRVLHLLVTLLPLLVLMVSGPAFCQQPVRIGFIFTLSGSLGTFGTISKQGAELAVEQLNETGGLMGRKIEGVYADSQGSAQTAEAVFRKLVQDDRVDAVIGPSLNDEAVPLAKLAEQLKVPLIIPVATTPDVTGKACNRYTFRVSQSLLQNIKSAALIAKDVKARKWTTVGPDYPYGHQSWELFKLYLKQLLPASSFVADSEAAFGSPDTINWEPQIDKVLRSDADGVLVSLFSNNLIHFVKQARPKGFFDRGYVVVMNLGASTEVLYNLKQDMPLGVWAGAPYWHEADVGPLNQIFVAAYRMRFGAVPSWNTAGPYAAVLTYAEAVKRTKSTKTADIIKILEGLTLDLPAGNITIRAEDHQAVTPGFWGKTAEDPAFRYRVLSPLRIISGADITPPAAETGCTMPR